MNHSTLKIIAIVTMLIDHIGATLLPEILILRIIGRLAFPIFVFLLVEGYHHTRNFNKYLIRLGVFALISEIPFDLAFFGKIVALSHQNVFFTLFLGLLMIKLFDHYKEKEPLLAGISVLVCMVMAYILKTDYDIFGLGMIFIYHQFREKKILAGSLVALVNIGMGLYFAGVFIGEFYLLGMVQSMAILALPLIYLYNGKKGLRLRYIFYAFYPVHLTFLYLAESYSRYKG